MGKSLFLFDYPKVLNTLHGTHDIPHMYHDIPHGTQISKDDIPTVLNTPMVLMISPYVHHDSPTVLNIPHGTQDKPHGTHDIPHGTEHPHGTQDIPPRYS